LAPPPSWRSAAGKIRKAEVEVTQIVQSLEEKPAVDQG